MFADDGAESIAAGRALQERYVLATLLLLPYAVLRFWYFPGAGPESYDANLYLSTARHLVEGRGLVTSVSMFYQGLRELPAPYTLPPLWPLTLAAVGSVIGLEYAAFLLTSLLWLAASVQTFFLARSLLAAVRRREDCLPRPPVSVAHLAMIAVASNPVFFAYASSTWTEPLGLVLLLATAQLSLRLVRTDSRSAAVAAGLTAGLAYLSRYQYLFLALAVPPALALLPGRRRWQKVLLSLAAAAAVIGAWSLFRLVRTGHFTATSLIDSWYPGVAGLAPAGFDSATAGELAAGFVRSLGRSFLLTETGSYVTSFGAAAPLVPIAALALLDSEVRKKAAVRPLAVAVMLGVAALLPSHLASARWGADLIGGRYGLPFVLLLVCALAVISVAHQWIRTLAVVLVIVAVAGGTWRQLRFTSTPYPGMITVEMLAAGNWLDRHADQPVVTTSPQVFAVFSDAQFHWIRCVDSPEQLRRMQERTGFRLMLLLPEERGCAFAATLGDDADALVRIGRDPATRVEIFDLGGAAQRR
jgi:hypothetical protein